MFISSSSLSFSSSFSRLIPSLHLKVSGHYFNVFFRFVCFVCVSFLVIVFFVVVVPSSSFFSLVDREPRTLKVFGFFSLSLHRHIDCPLEARFHVKVYCGAILCATVVLLRPIASCSNIRSLIEIVMRFFFFFF